VDLSSYRELQLLSEVDSDPNVTQRQLSRRIGIALGLTNVMLRNLVQKGYIRVAQATWKRRLYTLTPDGFLHRVRLVASYIHRVLDHYQNVRQILRQQLEPLALNEESRVAIFGTGEFAELVYLGLRENGIEEIDIYAPGSLVGRRFLGLPVLDVAKLRAGDYDRVVVALLGESEAARLQLGEYGVAPEKMVTFFGVANLKESD
jgi:DNA-binding MarR family transcriptional regulator